MLAFHSFALGIQISFLIVGVAERYRPLIIWCGIWTIYQAVAVASLLSR